MLNQLQKLNTEIDGRYATDSELQFITGYLESFNIRLSAYTKLQAAEAEIVQKVYAKMKATDSSLFVSNAKDISGKWKRDTIRVLRYSAVAMLVDDPNSLREKFLLWFQTIMRAFGAQRSCNTTYQVMQEVVKQYLTPAEANLVCPILELNRTLLGV